MGRKRLKKLNPKQVFVYIRVSTEEQAVSGLGLEAQMTAIELYCKMKQLEIVEVFRDEGVTSSVPLAKRPEGSELVRRIKAREAGAVITSKLDRMFRSTLEALTTVEGWQKIGFRGYFIDIGGMSLDTSSATGRLMFTLMSGIAELERTLISERTSAALQAKIKRGESLAKIPFGYQSQLVDGVKMLVKDLEEQETLELILELRADGLSVPKIRRKLNSLSILNRSKPWHLTSLYRILNR